MLDRRIVRTASIPPLRVSSAREGAFASWDASPVRDKHERAEALHRTVLYLKRVLPGEGYALGAHLGSGEWGEVYALRGHEAVVKISLDPYEAGFARFVQNFRQGVASYPRVDAVYKTPFGTYLIFREALRHRRSFKHPAVVLDRADQRLRRQLNQDVEVRHLDLHSGNILYRERDGRIEAVVADLGLSTYPATTSVAEVNPKRNPMSLYPKPSAKDSLAVIVAGFDESLSNVAAQALRAELPEAAAELAASWPESPDLVVMAPGRKKRTERVVVPVLLRPSRGFVPRGQVRAALTEARAALDYYAEAARKRGRIIEVYVHTLGADMGQDIDDAVSDIESLLADYDPTVVRVQRITESPRVRQGQLVAQIETALEEGDRRTAVRLLKSLKRTLYAEARRSR